MDGGDWRSQLYPDSRQRMVIKIADTLKRHLPFAGEEGFEDLKKIAERFEEKHYTAATSQTDYLRKISLVMLTMESKSQSPITNATSNSNNPADSAQSQLPVQENEVAASGTEATMDGGDWRNQLHPDNRQRIVIKIMETLKRHLPFAGDEGLQDLKKIAEMFEEKHYTAATSQTDYMRKIASKMLAMEAKYQSPITNATSNSNNPAESGDKYFCRLDL